ncbi:MAG TPA: EAL domain-containing protein [Candidatus Limnocylindrales bacterium]
MRYLHQPDAERFMRLTPSSSRRRPLEPAPAQRRFDQGIARAEFDRLGVDPSTLKLVRIRLTLALLSAAILPLALASPFLVQVGQQVQASGGAVDAASAGDRVDRELGGIRGRLLDARGSSSLAALAGGTTSAKTKATDTLDALVAADPGVVTGAWLLRADGTNLATSRFVALGGSAAALPASDAGGLASTAAPLPPGRIVAVASAGERPGSIFYLGSSIAAPGASAASSSGSAAALIVRISMSALLANAQVGVRGQVVAIVGTSPRQLVIGPNGPVTPAASALPFANAGRAPLTVPGLETWSIGIVPETLEIQMPAALLGALVALYVLAVILIAWLAHKVVGPAEQLDRARARLRDLYESARSDALQDALTGLGNHRAFMEEFDRQVEESRRYGADLSLLIIDLDDFKLVNDSAGHAVGDQLLVEVGRLLESTLRRPDRSFRIGGDEFAVLMPHTSSEAALVVARRLLAHCTEPRRDSPFPRPFAFTGGISSCPEFSMRRDELFAQADAALYDGKRRGRTTVSVFDPSRPDTKLEPGARAELSAKVARVVAAKALRPVYQPVVDLRTGRVLGFEGLIRPTAEAPFSNPGELFEAAELGGRTTELDFACIDTVLSGVHMLAPDQSLSINISPRSLEAAEFNTGSLLTLLGKHRVDPRRITIELTEREAVEDIDRLRSVLVACQAAGFRVAADDVGAGNAGLRLLSQIHFDIVKIDLSLVQDGDHRETSLAVLRALSDLAGRWGAMVVAEGVETASQLWTVQELGMSAAQGYLLGRPSSEPSMRSVDLGALLADAESELPLVMEPENLSRAS